MDEGKAGLLEEVVTSCLATVFGYDLLPKDGREGAAHQTRLKVKRECGVTGLRVQ